MFGENMGVDRHTWNDWCMLAGAITEYHSYIIKKWGEDAPEKQKELEEIYREKYRKAFEGKLAGTIDYLGIIRPYSDRLKLSGINLDSLTQEEENRINEERDKKGKQKLNWGRIRRLDELAKQCNESLRKTIYQNMPFEWKKLYVACKEANEITYGEGPSESFFEDIIIE
jgi:hypothetical protein